MPHTLIVEQLKKEYQFPNVPKEDLEACLETLDNFVLNYCPSDNMCKLLNLPHNLIRSFYIIERLYEIPNKQIKEGVTINSILETVTEHLENFEKMHENEVIPNDDFDYFDKQMINLFLE